MPLSNLPPLAKEAFADICDEVESAYNDAITIQRRIHEVENQIRNLNRETQADELAPYDQELVRQFARLSEAQMEHQQLAKVHTALKMWIDQIPISARYEDHETKFQLSVGENWDQECRTLRFEIDDANSELNGAINSIETLEETYADIEAEVDALVAQGNPKRIRRDGKPKTHWPPPQLAVAFAVWLHPEHTKKRMREEADADHKRMVSNGYQVMSRSDAKAAVKQFQEEVLALERKEEALIREASARGTTIPRRERASPLAILAIRPAIAKQVKAA